MTSNIQHICKKTYIFDWIRTRDFMCFMEPGYKLRCQCVQYSQDEIVQICVSIYSLLSILDLFSNRTSDTCKIQSSRLDRILWSHRWWKVVPSQKFVNIIIRNSNRFQVYQVSQILLVSSSGSMGVSCKVRRLNHHGAAKQLRICKRIIHAFQKFWKPEIK